jgi:hypothetical protein
MGGRTQNGNKLLATNRAKGRRGIKEFIHSDESKSHLSKTSTGTLNYIFGSMLLFQEREREVARNWLTRDEEEGRPECLVMRGAQGNTLFKVILPGSSGLTHTQSNSA